MDDTAKVEIRRNWHRAIKIIAAKEAKTFFHVLDEVVEKGLSRYDK